ncbi:uncharacterized protein LOC106083926 [Stomoxys calcitrans]|uniref:uncharacterized protein LOC106083926 n=1 Tax=Stomoxys calcitrans TaxID=35570 RepID=UPI0027E2D498|nr:uncharacterized protein LOC106083926 [Stomoxys calcitrans]
MFQCINLGQVLMDENLRVFYLCNNCNIDIRDGLSQFLEHLEACEGIGKLLSAFKAGQQLKYHTEKGIRKKSKAGNEFFIYDYPNVEISKQSFIDLMDIEEELLNPKWYSDLTTDIGNASASAANSSKKQYDILVKEVTPFVQFKEPCNVNSSKSRINKSQQKVSMGKHLTNVVPTLPNSTEKGYASKKIIATKRKLPIESVGNGPIQRVNNTSNVAPMLVSTKSNACAPIAKKIKMVENVTSLNAANPFPKTQFLAPKTSNIVTPSRNTTNTSAELMRQPTKEKETAQILSKLTNLGLQIKRTHPPMPATETAAPVTDDKTLQILRKLQSKGGMKVKLVNRQDSNKINVTGFIAQPHPIINEPILKKSNNLIIRKVK